MSNSLAIAAVTATLQSILHTAIVSEPDLGGATVTILPLDKARGSNTDNQLNLFLYMIVRNAAWVNADMPRQVKPGEASISPLPLNLYFLVTAFGKDDDATHPFGHELLGKAMSILYDHPILSPDDIRAATASWTTKSDLDQQLEHVRLTFHPLTTEDLSKLWTGFAMQYRLSVAYEAAVTLIESTRAARTPLPVLTRGPSDRGFSSQPDLTPPLPTLYTIVPPNKQPSARLGDVVTITGVHLDGTNVGVRFSHQLLPAPVEIPPQPGGTATSLTVQIPNSPTTLPAGYYSVDVLVERMGETFRRETNALALSLAPTVSLSPLSPSSPGATYSASVSPDALPAQRVSLMFGDRELVAAPVTSPTSIFTFSPALTTGTYPIRLRVDGVDSLLIDYTQTPPAFSPSQVMAVS